jgi:hypothetical protein
MSVYRVIWCIPSTVSASSFTAVEMNTWKLKLYSLPGVLFIYYSEVEHVYFLLV